MTPLIVFGYPTSWSTAIYRKRYTFFCIVANQKYFQACFMDWLSRNYEIFLAFEAEADRVWNAGVRHFGARLIGEHLRYESRLRQVEPGVPWKIDNSIFPDLARLYTQMHPDRDGFFETRVCPLSVRAA